MKRILTLTLALAMSLSLLTACGSSNDSAAPSGDDGSDAAGEMYQRPQHRFQDRHPAARLHHRPVLEPDRL